MFTYIVTTAPFPRLNVLLYYPVENAQHYTVFLLKVQQKLVFARFTSLCSINSYNMETRSLSDDEKYHAVLAIQRCIKTTKQLSINNTQRKLLSCPFLFFTWQWFFHILCFCLIYVFPINLVLLNFSSHL